MTESGAVPAASSPRDSATPRPTSRNPALTWMYSIFVIFALSGLSLSTWFVRLPAVRDHLDASSGQIGVLLLSLSAGSITGLLTASRTLDRLGAKRTIVFSMALCAVAFVAIGIAATSLESYPAVLIGLYIYGIGSGSCNVAMNVEAAAVERALGRSVMPLFHAVYSVGGVIGAGLGALASAFAIPVAVHLGAIALLLATVPLVCVRTFLPHSPGSSKAGAADVSPPRSVWRESRTLWIGVVVLGASFAAGSANDWIGLAMVDGYRVSTTTAATVVWVYVVSTTVARVVGTPLLDRFGRVAVLRVSATVTGIGIILFVFGGSEIGAVVGVVFWGLGAALAFPVGMSAAADDPNGAARRISAVATIGYGATLLGPVSIGFLGEHVGLLNALLVVLLFTVLAGVASTALRRPEPVAA